MNLAHLRMLIRSMVHGERTGLDPEMPWHESDSFRELSSAEQASVRALAGCLLQAHGDFGAVLSADRTGEWC